MEEHRRAAPEAVGSGPDADYPFFWRPLLPQLARLDLELDQRLRQAWDLCSSPRINEVDILCALVKLNGRPIECLPESFIPTYSGVSLSPFSGMAKWGTTTPLLAEIDAPCSFPIWTRTVQLARGSGTVTTRHFCRAIAETLLSPWKGAPANTPQIVRVLGSCYGEYSGSRDSGAFGDVPALLHHMPQTRHALKQLGRVPQKPDGFLYAVYLEAGRPVFRALSVLGDYAVRAGSHGPVPVRALLTHFQHQFGAFTEEEIRELEQMLADPSAGEADLQRFFESHPHFLRRWDYREVCPHPHLVRRDGSPLVPDFVLTNRELHQAWLLELKHPRARVVRRQRNRDRLGGTIMEARAQLLEYARWFEREANREALVARVGMEIYRPKLAVIVGRSSEFRCARDRQELLAANPELEVVTYDDIVEFARRRLIVMAGAHPP